MWSSWPGHKPSKDRETWSPCLTLVAVRFVALSWGRKSSVQISFDSKEGIHCCLRAFALAEMLMWEVLLSLDLRIVHLFISFRKLLKSHLREPSLATHIEQHPCRSLNLYLVSFFFVESISTKHVIYSFLCLLSISHSRKWETSAVLFTTESPVPKAIHEI